LFWSISTQSEKLFWKWTSWTMWMMKYCLSMTMKTSYIQWSFIARTWFSQNATTRSMIKNCWSLFAIWNIDTLNWNVRIFQSRSSSIIWIWSTEFVNNNAISSSIEQSAFFLNKSFHSRMSFNLNSTEYEITWAKIEVSKAKNIFEHMKWSLALIKQALARVRVTMKKQIDKHRKEMIYKIDDMMFLNSRNIMISRSSKKLDDKMLKFFKILIEIKHAYWLKLSSTMKIHSEFASNLLQLDSKDALEE